jgi:hypothetical protein
MKVPDSALKFLLFLIVNLVVHLPFLNLPPCGAHVWRQCNTLAMSRNFATEDMNILKPRIDRRNESDGITGSHFPLYEWVLALLSKAFGFSELLARIYSLLIFSLGMLAFYLVLLQLRIPPIEAAFGSLLLLSVPQLYYDSINAMPDIMALALSLFALYFFLRFFLENSLMLLVTAIIFAIAGGLIKFQFLIIPASSIAFMRFRWSRVLLIIIATAAVVCPIVLWYRYALRLTQVHNLKEFGLWIQPVTAQQKLNTIINNLISDLPELLTGWPLLICLLVFAGMKIRKFRLAKENTLLLIWIAGFLVFYFVAIERMMHHSYYFMAIIPAFIIVFLRSIQEQKNLRRIVLIVLALNFTWAFGRIIPSRWSEGKMNLPITFIEPDLRNELQNSIPRGAKCVVGPDVSGCIYFYFTNTKGYSFERPDELLQMKVDGVYLDVMKKNGVKFLVCNQYERMGPVLEHFARLKSIRLKNTVGDFQVWEILESDEL